jgi:hypothetical protein
MFSKVSRYRSVPDIAVLDAKGRVVAAKDSRPLPVVTGTFTHTVRSGDRLDQLAETYYGQPLLYWRICDANPQAVSPLALLGAEPVATARFPLLGPASPPPLAVLLRRLAGTVGVEAVTLAEDVAPPARAGGPELVTQAVVVTYNRVHLDTTGVLRAIELAGFDAGPAVEADRAGQQIVIPPPVSG